MDSFAVTVKSVRTKTKFASLILAAVLLSAVSLSSCVGHATSPAPGAPDTHAVDPTSLYLGSVTVGATSTAQAVMVTNSSSSGSTTVSAITVSGPFASNGVTLPVALNAGQGLTLNVTFTPTASGAATGTLTITSTAGNSPTTVALVGTGASSSPG